MSQLRCDASCRIGAVVEALASNESVIVDSAVVNRDQTDGSCPNTLVVLNCDVVKPRVAATEHISQALCSSSPPNFTSFRCDSKRICSTKSFGCNCFF